jgi:hypothetical protein
MVSSVKGIRRWPWTILLIGVVPLIAGGCLLPPAAGLQDARMVGEGNVRATAFWSGHNATGEDNEKLADEYGALLGIGTSDRVEMQIRFDRIAFTDGDGGYQFLSVGPKFGLIRDRLALLVPAGMYFGEDMDGENTVQLQPEVLGSLPVDPRFELNAVGRFILPIDRDLWSWLTLGFGVGLSTDFNRWALLPEVSYSICVDEDEVDPVISYGLALVFLTGD